MSRNRHLALAALILAGCASRPGFNYDPGQGTPLTITGSQNPSYIEAQRLAAAKNMNLHVVTLDGVRLYCRSNLIAGSRIVSDTTCYTAEQVDEMQERTQRELKFLLSPNFAIQHP